MDTAADAIHQAIDNNTGVWEESGIMDYSFSQLLTGRMGSEIFDLIANIKNLESSIKTLIDETQGLKAEIPEMQVQL